MNFKLEFTEYEKIQVLKIKGELMGREFQIFEFELYKILSNSDFGKDDIIFDLTELNKMDSGGLGLIISQKTFFNRLGYELVIAGVNGKPNRVLKTTQLNSVFKIFSTVKEAAEYLQSK